MPGCDERGSFGGCDLVSDYEGAIRFGRTPVTVFYDGAVVYQTWLIAERPRDVPLVATALAGVAGAANSRPVKCD